MNILFLSDNFPPEVNASASRVFERACYWVQKGHKITVLTCAPNFPQGKVYPGYKNKWLQQEDKQGVHVIRVKTFMAPNKGTVLRTLDFISYMVMAVGVGVFQKKPDIIVATSPQFFTALGGWILSKLKGVPFVFEISDLWPEAIKGLGLMGESWVYRTLEKIELFLYKHSRLIIAQTPAFKANLVSRGIDSAKIAVILNGVDTGKYTPITHKDETLLKAQGLEKKFVVGYIGTHGMAQDLKKIIDVAQQVQKHSETIRFLFVGDGAERQDLIKYAQTQGVTNVLFIPQQPKEDIQKWWSLCDIALVALKDVPIFETVIPSKIFEAAALDLPVLLVAPKGEASHLVSHEKIGIFIPARDETAIAEKILSLSTTPAWRQKLKLNPRAAAQKHSREKQAKAFVKALSETISKKSR